MELFTWLNLIFVLSSQLDTELFFFTLDKSNLKSAVDQYQLAELAYFEFCLINFENYLVSLDY